MKTIGEIEERITYLKGYLQSIINLIQGNYKVMGDIAALRGQTLLALGELKALYWVAEKKEQEQREEAVNRFFEELRKDIEEQKKLQEQERQRLEQETKEAAKLIAEAVRKAIHEQQ